MRNLELPGRSTVHSKNGMAATSHTLSTLTAISVLQNNGNAMDAAIAACAVQCVVEPQSTGIGGDCFCIFSPEGSTELVAFNGSGKAPKAATYGWYQNNQISEIKRQSPHAVTVPGAVDGWEQLLKSHGTKELGELLQPAITLAEEGYSISPRVSVDWSKQIPLLLKDNNAKKRFLPFGRAPKVGETHHQPELAKTLRSIAKHGKQAFYSGEVAEDIVNYLQSLGGLHTLEDFENAAGSYVTPIKTNFRGHDIYECPPNGQGVIALLLLNIASKFPPHDKNPISTHRLHMEIEAGKLAYQDRNTFVADPSKSDVPVNWLLSDDHATELFNHINPEYAMHNLPKASMPNHDDTVYITVIDKKRNACSFINTLFNAFGSCQLAPKSGVMLQNRGQGFVIEKSHPNCIGPNKRPMHTIIPGMVTKNNKVQMSFGVMGGHYQSFGHMHFLTKHFDFGLDMQEAMDLPRIFPIPGTKQVEIESGLPIEIIAGLKAKGHSLIPASRPIGGAQAISIDWENGTLTGASEPRKDGCAIGY